MVVFCISDVETSQKGLPVTRVKVNIYTVLANPVSGSKAEAQNKGEQ